MKRPETSSYEEWMDQRVEAYVDGDLPEEERDRFEQILADDEYWRVQVRQARRIQDALHDLPTPVSPPSLTQSILSHTSRAHQPLPWWKDALQHLMHTWRALVAARRRPSVDYAVGLALVAVAVFFIVMPLNDAPSPTQSASQLNTPLTAPYSPSEVEHAERKVKWTFGYLDDLADSAAHTVESKVRQDALLNDGTRDADSSATNAPSSRP